MIVREAGDTFPPFLMTLGASAETFQPVGDRRNIDDGRRFLTASHNLGHLHVTGLANVAAQAIVVIGYARRVGGPELVTYQAVLTTLYLVRDGLWCGCSDGRDQPHRVASGTQCHIFFVAGGNRRCIDSPNGVTGKAILAPLQ